MGRFLTSLLFIIFSAVPLTAFAEPPLFDEVARGVYRGGRPDRGDLSELERYYRVRTVLNLEDKDGVVDEEERWADKLDLKFINIEMDSSDWPDDDEIDAALAAMSNPRNHPIFVHCKHGRDRTGLVIGLYRVEVQGWSPERAYREMLDHGFRTYLKNLRKYFEKRTGYRSRD